MVISASVKEDEDEPQPTGGSSNRHNSKKIELGELEKTNLKSSEEIETLHSEEEMAIEEDEEESIGSSYRPESMKLKVIGELEKMKSKSSKEDETTLQSDEETTLQSDEETTLQSEEEKKSKEEFAITLDLPNYNIMGLIAEGTFGKVYKAEHKLSKEIVAVKTFKKETYVTHWVKREIKILKLLQHPNIIRLIEVVGEVENEDGEPVYLIFEYMEYDLKSLTEREAISAHVIKDYMHQLLSGLLHCHANEILHRDIKGANVLLSKEGVLKIADFGMSRPVEEEDDQDYGLTMDSEYYRTVNFDPIFTPDVITLAYRPPEVLLGLSIYEFKVDIWSAGVVFAQLLNNGKHIFCGSTKTDQLKSIYELCGSANEDNWPGVSALYDFNKAKKENPVHIERCIRDTFKHFASDALALLDEMLVLDPSKRISAKNALRHPYFLRSSKSQQQMREEEAANEETL